MTAPIIPFYEALGLLKRVNGVGTPDEVTSAINGSKKHKTASQHIENDHMTKTKLLMLRSIRPYIAAHLEIGSFTKD